MIGLELYTDGEGERPHSQVVRTQWLELASTQLVGRRILIVDEVGGCSLSGIGYCISHCTSVGGLGLCAGRVPRAGTASPRRRQSAPCRCRQLRCAGGRL